MKYIKMLGLLAVAAAALMAFAGTASATVVKSGGSLYTSTIKASSSNGELHGSFITVKCTSSTVEGKVESHGETATAKGNIPQKGLTFTGCNYPVTVLKEGSLEVHKSATTGNGTLTSSGAEILIHTSIGECIFTTTNTDIGTVLGSSNNGGKAATLNINSSEIPRTGGNFFCGSFGTWTGSYTVGTPSTLDIH